MAHPDTQEKKLLSKANDFIAGAIPQGVNDAVARLSLLEAVVCYKTGFQIEEYRNVTGFAEHFDWGQSEVLKLTRIIEDIDMPLPLALAGLARIDGGELETKRNGAVYTDFRLAIYLAETAMQKYESGPVIDPACGTAIVLAACANYVRDKEGTAHTFVSKSLYGADLSAHAVRGSLLVLATFLGERAELELLVSHFACMDSLAAGEALSRYFGLEHFELVVGNPPWERVRPSRSEFARERGLSMSYGAELKKLPDGYERHRAESKDRAALLAKKYNLKGGADLYRAFFRLSINICRENGTVILYLPAGLIRSKTLAPEREVALANFAKTDIAVFTNRSKFFSIDSRFKFVLATLCGKGKVRHSDGVTFMYCSATAERVVEESSVLISDDFFCDKSNELGAPEVKTDREVAVLQTIWRHGIRMAEHPLFGGIRPLRELDMTLDRWRFKRSAELTECDEFLPLIEGRMVSSYRCGAKKYLGGAGRSAKWATTSCGTSDIVSQFYIAPSDLDDSLIERTQYPRVGYCDIAGQTNERAMQAAPIPSDCVCGNKVPTLLYKDDGVAMLWLGIANSFTFDWLVRRYITTTINFFILNNLPLPIIDLSDEWSKEIVRAVRCVVELERIGSSWGEDERWSYACCRARIDACVFRAYGLQPADLQTIVDDFPLVDQENAKVCNGIRPTIELFSAYVREDENMVARLVSECGQKAMPYASNEYIRERLSANPWRWA